MTDCTCNANFLVMQDFLKSGESNERRCDSPESLKARSCKEDHVINPVKHPLIYVKNSKLSNSAENVVQLKPQNINITLRVGEFTQTYSSCAVTC